MLADDPNTAIIYHSTALTRYCTVCTEPRGFTRVRACTTEPPERERKAEGNSLGKIVDTHVD